MRVVVRTDCVHPSTRAMTTAAVSAAMSEKMTCDAGSTADVGSGLVFVRWRRVGPPEPVAPAAARRGPRLTSSSAAVPPAVACHPYRGSVSRQPPKPGASGNSELRTPFRVKAFCATMGRRTRLRGGGYEGMVGKRNCGSY